LFLHYEIKITQSMRRVFYIILVIVTISLTILLANKVVQPKNILEKHDDWSLVWSDEFNGEIINRNNWNNQIERAGRFNDEWQRYTDSEKNAFIDDGKLVINAIHVGKEHGMNKYTSARLNTANKKTWRYGKIEARIKLPEGNGLWPAFWMLGSNIDENGGDTSWPETGEIDIIELYGSKSPSVVEANIHYSDKNNKHKMMGAVKYELTTGDFSNSYNNFSIEWNKESINWFVNNEQYASVSIIGPEFTEFHKDFFILFNVAVGGKYAGRPDESTIFPQKMYVDWVRFTKNQLS